MSRKPVVFLAFANVRDNTVQYLRNLPEEQRRIRAALEHARSAGLCELVERSNATTREILDVFQHSEYRDRIAIFHYGGHADGYQLLLESPEGRGSPAHASGFAAFLGEQRGLQLVFLNGCSTQSQAQGLLNANVKLVIATSQDIADDIATELATRFYVGLASGADIRTSFNQATAAIRTDIGDDLPSYYHGVPAENLRWPWDIYLNPGAEEDAQWSLLAAARDWLFGLPKLPLGDLPSQPYRHLHWFTRKHAEVFFGRGRQIRELHDLVTTPDTAPIILLYGQSGVGKSSLLEAGLLPRLESNHVTRHYRRTQESGLLGTLREAFGAAEKTTLSQAWLALENENKKPAIVVLDQIEEVFTRPHSGPPDELQSFIAELRLSLADLALRPQGKLILGFRKEWLAEIEKRLIDNGLYHTKIFLERLDREGIIEAISGPARTTRLQRHYGLSLADGLAEIIADDLLADRDSPLAPTLQILLTKMWDEATQQNRSHPHFDHELYNRLKKQGILLQDFLNEQLEGLHQWQPEVVELGLALDVLAFHTTSLGAAEQRTSEELAQEYRHRQDVLPALVQKCKDLYLLVDLAADQPEAALATATRLAHDTLAPLVRRHFDESDQPGQRARRILENRSVEWRDDKQGNALEKSDFARVEEGERGMRAWKPDEHRLIEASRKRKAQTQRNRKILQGAGIVAILAILFSAAVAWWQRNEAIKLAAEAKLRESAALAQIYLDDRLDLGLLLSLEAFKSLNSVIAKNNLLLGLQHNPHLDGFLHGHTNADGVRSLAFSPDGKTLASAMDTTITLWNVETRKSLGRSLTGHKHVVGSVAFRPNGKVIASGDHDGAIIFWDAATSQQIGDTLINPHDAISSLVFDSSGKILASASDSGKVILWNVNTNEPLGDPFHHVFHRAPVSSMAFSPDSRILATGGMDGIIGLWDVDTRWPFRGFAHREPAAVMGVAFTSNAPNLVFGMIDGSIFLWDIANNLQLDGHRNDREYADSHQDRVTSFAFNPNSKILASGGWDKTINIDLAKRL